MLSTPTPTQLSHVIPNADIQLSIPLNSSYAVPPFETHISRRLIFTFPRFMSKIRTVRGFILGIPLSLEPSVAAENGDFCICAIKEFLEKNQRKILKPWSQFYIVQIPVHKKYSVNLIIAWPKTYPIPH